HTRFSRDWSSDVCSSDLARMFLLYRFKQVNGELAHVSRQQRNRHHAAGSLSRLLDLCHEVVKRGDELARPFYGQLTDFSRLDPPASPMKKRRLEGALELPQLPTD